MDPGVFSGRVEGGRWKGVKVIGAISQSACCEGVRCFDGIGEVHRRFREWLRGEEANCLGHRWLEQASMRRIRAAVRREDLTVCEERLKKSVDPDASVTVVRARVVYLQTYFESKYHNSLGSIYDLKD